jgi:hypoxanthine phosphoribosyltransferase
MPFYDGQVDTLYGESQLQARIQELGAEISRDYAGQQLVVVGVLKGSVLFFADLIRRIDLPLAIDFLGLSSYGSGTESSGVVRITNDLSKSIENKHVLVVEDIVDTGLTMKFLLENLSTRKPSSVKICTLLEKPARAKVKVPIHYKGFTIPDEFVVGYGLDFDEKYRNLPFIGVMRR